MSSSGSDVPPVVPRPQKNWMPGRAGVIEWEDGGTQTIFFIKMVHNQRVFLHEAADPDTAEVTDGADGKYDVLVVPKAAAPLPRDAPRISDAAILKKLGEQVDAFLESNPIDPPTDLAVPVLGTGTPSPIVVTHRRAIACPVFSGKNFDAWADRVKIWSAECEAEGARPLVSDMLAAIPEKYATAMTSGDAKLSDIAAVVSALLLRVKGDAASRIFTIFVKMLEYRRSSGSQLADHIIEVSGIRRNVHLALRAASSPTVDGTSIAFELVDGPVNISSNDEDHDANTNTGTDLPPVLWGWYLFYTYNAGEVAILAIKSMIGGDLLSLGDGEEKDGAILRRGGRPATPGDARGGIGHAGGQSAKSSFAVEEEEGWGKRGRGRRIVRTGGIPAGEVGLRMPQRQEASGLGRVRSLPWKGEQEAGDGGEGRGGEVTI